MSMEHFIGALKETLKAMQARLGPLQVDKSIMGMNFASFVKRQETLMLEFPTRKASRAYRTLTASDLAIVGSMLREADVYNVFRTKINFDSSIHGIFDDLCDDDLDHAFDMYRLQYKRNRVKQPF